MIDKKKYNFISKHKITWFSQNVAGYLLEEVFQALNCPLSALKTWLKKKHAAFHVEAPFLAFLKSNMNELLIIIFCNCNRGLGTQLQNHPTPTWGVGGTDRKFVKTVTNVFCQKMSSISLFIYRYPPLIWNFRFSGGIYSRVVPFIRICRCYLTKIIWSPLTKRRNFRDKIIGSPLWK